MRPSLSFVAVAACLTGALALPAQLDARAVSQDVYNKLAFFEQYAAAAYSPTNNNSTGTKVTCSAGNCPLVEAADTKTVLEFENSLATDVTGFVATDSTNKLVVVAFRGSESVRNYLADVNFLATGTDICTGCAAELGFWSSWSEARTGVLAAVKAASAANPTYSIIVVGHSLGGAIADFAAAQLRNDGNKVALYTYGSPRIGFAGISTYISNQPGGNYRVTHKNDPVPKLPPIALGYVHITPEYYITSPNNVTVTPADIQVLTGAINTSGNTGDGGFDTKAHTWYFNAISASYPANLFEFRRV